MRQSETPRDERKKMPVLVGGCPYIHRRAQRLDQEEMVSSWGLYRGP